MNILNDLIFKFALIIAKPIYQYKWEGSKPSIVNFEVKKIQTIKVNYFK
jgi:hypothetical protein